MSERDRTTEHHEQQLTRREIVRRGAKLAFVPPLIVTFTAQQAMAAGSNHSCYPAGHACEGIFDAEPCCPGLVCLPGGPGSTCQ